MAITKLGPGETMATLALPDPQGGLFHFVDQAESGRVAVLWLGEASDDQTADRIAETLGRWAPAFAAVEAAIFGVVLGRAPPASRPPASRPPADPAARILFDPEKRLAAAFGFAAGGIIVLDADLRVAASGGDLGLEAALAICHDLHDRTAPDTLCAQAPVHLVQKVLEPELCRALIAYWEAGEKKADLVALSLPEGRQALPDLKKRADVVVGDPALIGAIQERFARRLVPEVQKVFSYRMTTFESARVGCYSAETGGYFRRHRDNMTPQTARRRFAISLNLNTGSYEGGQVRFPEYSRALYAPALGAALVFSCSLVHEALPVTAGRRFGAFTFAIDPDPGPDHDQQTRPQK